MTDVSCFFCCLCCLSLYLPMLFVVLYWMRHSPLVEDPGDGPLPPGAEGGLPLQGAVRPGELRERWEELDEAALDWQAADWPSEELVL